MHKRDNRFAKTYGMPPESFQDQAQFWCKNLGITPEQLMQMSEEEMEHRMNVFREDYLKSAKKSDGRHYAYQPMKEQTGSSPQSYNSARDDRHISPRRQSPQRSARKAAAAAKVQRQLEEEAVLEEQEKQQRYEQMKKMQEKQALQQKQIREQEIREKKLLAKKHQEEMKRQEEMKHQEEIKYRQRLAKHEELLEQQRQKIDRQTAQSPNRGNRTREPRAASPSRQQYYEELQRQNQLKEAAEQQRQMKENFERKRRAWSPSRQQHYDAVIQRQTQINEEVERQRIMYEKYRRKQEEAKQKHDQLERQRLVEEQQKQERYFQSDELPSPEEGEFTEAAPTEAEDVDTMNDCDEDGRLEGGIDTDIGCDDEHPTWKILAGAAEDIEGHYGQPSGPKASNYPPGVATYRMKGVDVNKNTFDLNLTYDGRTDQTNYKNKVFKKAPTCDQAGGQDYINYERGGQDYGYCEESSAEDLENDPDFEDEDEEGPNPIPDYLHMNPKVRTVSTYEVEYSEDGIDESEQNVTVENDGRKQTVRVQSRGFVGGIPKEFDDSDDQYGYEEYPACNDYLGGSFRSNLRTTAAGGRVVETKRVTKQRDGTVRRAHHVSQRDPCGRTRKTSSIDTSPLY